MKISNTKAVAWLLLTLSAARFATGNAFASQQSMASLPRKDTSASFRLRESVSSDDKERFVDSASTTKSEAQNEPSAAEDIPRGGANIQEAPPASPTVRQFRQFALPCLALWIAQPLLSLVDTAFVGLSSEASSSAQQLAALGPATTFFDGATYLFAFLNVATTNLYSSALAQRGEESEKAESVVRTASRVASRCGLGIMLFLFAFARPLLALYIGSEAASTPGLLDSAVDYVIIRAFSLPTTLLLGVVQAALLGAKDSVTPLIAILYSTIVNIFGDFLLVKNFGMGLRGAAIATLFAQWAATFALLGPARRRLVRDHSLGIFKKPPQTSEAVSGRSFLGFAAPVLTLILGKLAAFGFLTNSAAGVPGQPTPLATHQIILSLFFFVSPFLEVISQTAQTFIPPFLAPVNDHVTKQQSEDPSYNEDVDKFVAPWKNAAFIVGNTLMRFGLLSGIVVASLVSLVPAFGGSILTSDAIVQEAVKPLAKYLWIGAFLTAPTAVSEGILLARRELKFLAGVYVVSTALLPPALLRVKVTGGNVEQVWACFAAFQLFRSSLFAGRIWSGSIMKRITGMVGMRKPSKAVDVKTL